MDGSFLDLRIDGPTGLSSGVHGTTVSGGRDFDGDGVPDFALAVSNEMNPTLGTSGTVRVYSGAGGIGAPPRFTLYGQFPNDGFGRALDCTGDMDGDGLGDILVGAPLTDTSSMDAGVVWAFSGLTGQVIRNWPGAANRSFFGRDSQYVGDLDGDGFDDVTAMDGLLGFQSCPVYSGRTGGLITTVLPATVMYPGFGVDELSARGDINGDGTPDLVISSPEPAPPIGTGGLWSVIRVWSLAAPATASATVFGSCSPGGPFLAMQPPAIGYNPWVGVYSAPAASPGVLFIGQAPAAPFSFLGCTAYVSPMGALSIPFITDAAGVWGIQVPIPYDTTLLGAPGRAQAIVVPTGQPAVLSSAAAFQIGY